MNVKISILIQMDPFERLNQNTDTTFCLIIEALKRNYKVMCCEPKDIYFENKKINAYASNLSLTNKNQIIKEKKQEDLNLSSFDVVLLRKDPPFDMNYITNTYLNTYQFQKEVVLIINPLSGKVEGVIDFSGLKEKVEQIKTLNVLNGIAYNKERKTIFITGKNWSKVFEIKLKNK